MNLEFKLATDQDAPVLSEMNQQLIRDEKHRNKMSLPQLEKRMRDFLASEYRAVIAELEFQIAGYALYKIEPEWVYLRQLYVKESLRKNGIGKQIVEFLKYNVCNPNGKIRIEVLTGNLDGVKFWRAIGFKDYVITMEIEARRNDV